LTTAGSTTWISLSREDNFVHQVAIISYSNIDKEKNSRTRVDNFLCIWAKFRNQPKQMATWLYTS